MQPMSAPLRLGTVIGLCLGGGQIAPGLAATALGLFALWGFKWIEVGLPRERYARIAIEATANGPGETEIRRAIAADGLAIITSRLSLDVTCQRRSFEFEPRDTSRVEDTRPPGLPDQQAGQPGIAKVQWSGQL
jgi:putative Mg2+ transporter-C (MgtC) family protein